MSTQGTSGKDAELVKGLVHYFGSVDLLQYYIISYAIIDNNKENENADADQIWSVQVQVKLGRRIMNQAVSEFLPSFIICTICYFTNYFEVSTNIGRDIRCRCKCHLLFSIFQPQFFVGTIGVNAMSLITLTTLFTSVLENLPRTAYLKLIDFWWYHLPLKMWQNYFFVNFQVCNEYLHPSIGAVPAHSQGQSAQQRKLGLQGIWQETWHW